MRPLFVILVLMVGVLPAWGQTDGLLQIGDPTHRFLEVQYALGRLPGAYLSHQPLSAYEARRYLDSLAAADARAAADSGRTPLLSPAERLTLARLRGEAAGRGVARLRSRLPYLYRNGRDFASVEGDGYALQVNPLLYLAAGPARARSADGRDSTRWGWQNTRGVRASGHVGRYLYFESRLEETQRRDVWAPAADMFGVPRLGMTQFPDDGVYDYMLVTGVVGVRTRFFDVRFGRAQNHWGYGPGSLVLSNYATGYDQLQLRTTVWRLQYTNLFSGFADVRAKQPVANAAIPRKYGAFHRLVLNVTDGLQLGVFESIVFGTDTLGARKGFDLAYANPIIFYRAAERDRGSPDNALLGADLSWIVRPGAQVYGQFLLDELVVDGIGKGWWTNKWGWLGGVYLAGLPVPEVTLRVEYARLRPYLYSHRAPTTAYVHYEDLLGHPAGPNAEDLSVFVSFDPAGPLRVALDVAATRRGRDADGLNYGSDPLASYDSRTSDRDVWLLQGVRQRQLLVEGWAGYELLPDLYLEAALRAEHQRDARTGTAWYVLPAVQLRWGLPFRSTRW